MAHSLTMFGFSFSKRVYLDYAGATPLHPSLRAIDCAHSWANPGSIHTEGVAAKAILARARAEIAQELGCKARDIVFVSGGTEANNLAILGTFKQLILSGTKPQDTHWIVSSIEHPSVLACFDHIEQVGGKVVRLPVDERGLIAESALRDALTPQTKFVSIGWANGEIGAVQRIHALAHVIHTYEERTGTTILFHTDAGQAPLYLSSHVHELGVDLLSLDAAKLYGPRGIGALYLSGRAAIAPQILGGGQERGLRAGTENTSLAALFANAYTLIVRERKQEAKRLQELRVALLKELKSGIPGILMNGQPEHTLPHILNVSVPGEQNGEYLALALDHAGFAVATKSACREGEGNVSHVVAALGGGVWHPRNTVRVSLGRNTTEKDLRRFAHTLARIAT